MVRLKSSSLPGMTLFCTTEHPQSGYKFPVVIDENAKAIGPMDAILYNGQVKTLGLLEITEESLSWVDRVDYWNRLSRAGYTLKQIQKP